jgi:uncharacterized protein with von Willebrand factor type A (vWA) domain
MLHFVSVVLDESGSMEWQASATRKGVNTFFAQLREVPANLRVSLLKFNEFPTRVFTNAFLGAVRDVTEEDYAPGGGTRLYDSILDAVRDLEPKVDPEAKATVVIVTDGADTSSVTSLEGVREVIARKQETGRWTFLFFGPDEEIGKGMGIDKTFALDGGSVQGVFETAIQEVKLLTAGEGVIQL